MDPADPAVAQKIVGEYAALLEQDAREERYPASVSTLPHPKETIKTAIRTSLEALALSGQLTDELRDFLEVAYVSLADYVDDELVRLMSEYQRAGTALTERTLAKERKELPAWQVLERTGRLAGEIARAIAQETEALRGEFRQLHDRT